jgi:hypothetical protein
MLARTALPLIALLALARSAFAAEPTEEEIEAEQFAQLSEDTWFIRLEAGGAYVRALTQYRRSGADVAQQKHEVMSFAPTVELAIAARLGRDVTLGVLGSIAHAPAVRDSDGWHGKSQGMYYAAAYIDHRLPARVLHLGGGIGPGYLYTTGPELEDFGGIGPVGTVWFGLDLPSSKRVALGLTADVAAGAISHTHALDDGRNDFDVFMLVVGLAFTIRISEPSWPSSLPSLARASRQQL